MNDPFKRAWDTLRKVGTSVTVSTDDIPKETLLKLIGSENPKHLGMTKDEIEAAVKVLRMP